MSQDFLWDDELQLEQLLAQVRAPGWTGWPQNEEATPPQLFSQEETFQPTPLYKESNLRKDIALPTKTLSHSNPPTEEYRDFTSKVSLEGFLSTPPPGQTLTLSTDDFQHPNRPTPPPGQSPDSMPIQSSESLAPPSDEFRAPPSDESLAPPSDEFPAPSSDEFPAPPSNAPSALAPSIPLGRVSSFGPYAAGAKQPTYKMGSLPQPSHPKPLPARLGAGPWASKNAAAHTWWEKAKQTPPPPTPQHNWLESGQPSSIEHPPLDFLRGEVEKMFRSLNITPGPLHSGDSREVHPLLTDDTDFERMRVHWQRYWKKFPFQLQLRAFLEWMYLCTGSYMVFAVDEEGNPLAELHADDIFMEITSMLPAHVLIPLRSYLFEKAVSQLALQQVVLEIEDDYVFQVIWIQTPIGRVALGLIAPLSVGGLQLQVYQQLLLLILGNS